MQKNMATRLIIIALIMAGFCGQAAAQEKSVNLYLEGRSGWTAPVVPRIHGTSTTTSCLVDDILYRPDLWLNAHGRNGGGTMTPGGFDVTFYLDGQLVSMGSAPATAGEFSVLNLGPFSRDLCGRHTVSAYVDALHSIAETDEYDNTWAGQFIWPARVVSLTADPVIYSAPPAREGGWDHSPDPSGFLSNCDGFMFDVPPQEWAAVTVRPLDPQCRYTMDLYDFNEDSSTLGFGDPLDICNNAAGDLSGIVVHQPYGGFPFTSYNVGVTNWSGTADYRIKGHLPRTLTPDVTYTGEFGPDGEFALFTFSLQAQDQGWKNILLESDPEHPMRLGLLDPDYGTFDLAHYPAAGLATNAWGSAYQNIEVTDSRQYGVTVFADTPEVLETCQFDLKLVDAMPNLQPGFLMYWDYPLTPTNQPSQSHVYLPEVLYGDSATTYLNFIQRNNSGAATGANFITTVALDGISYTPFLIWGGLDAFATDYFKLVDPVTVPGGRHTLSLRIDSNNAIEELLEEDNSYAIQTCWRPTQLPYGEAETLPPPPAKYGGHSLANPGTPLQPNFSARRIPGLNPIYCIDYWWRGMAVIPAADVDVNVELFPEYTTSTGSFTSPQVTSQRGSGLTDFVLVNMNYQWNHDAPFEIGFTREAGADSFRAETVASTMEDYGNEGPSGWYGPWNLAEGRIMQIKEFWFNSGLLAVKLDNISGDGTLGLSIFSSTAEYASPTSTVDRIIQEVAPSDGQDVTFTLDIPISQFCCVVVWKNGTADLDKSIDYRLCLYQGLTPAEDSPPLATRLDAPRPNPFNPRTTLGFTLEKAGHARLAIYDLRGLLVRTLCDEDLAAGRHDATWSGTDGNGNQVGSGVYVARLESGGVVQSRRLVLVR